MDPSESAACGTEPLLQTIQICRYHLVILCPVRCAHLALLQLYDKPFRVVFRYGLVKLQHQAACTSEVKLEAASMSTATIRDTPCSCMVTPISWLAISIAILLCEMNRNWVFEDMRLTMLQKRSVLASSSGASTSSSKQNGAGFNWNIENTSAVAVSAFSPPDSK